MPEHATHWFMRWNAVYLVSDRFYCLNPQPPTTINSQFDSVLHKQPTLSEAPATGIHIRVYVSYNR